jgi:hypothetical protein
VTIEVAVVLDTLAMDIVALIKDQLTSLQAL